ncbi:YhdP family protein [Stenotrophomonas sp. CFBP 13718]|uniref:YhdP family protein n=1 Tax=Stenotrophomonas sp. CFBP 13718 TaxID=2775304 RepID=UPI00178682E6|nr:YhdP family protein [Stenotrophomonas sp. CFBP 13718]MBD8696207.1 TIGR02099 family protein [Stenotrophomonas sp. CFBP 13718]
MSAPPRQRLRRIRRLALYALAITLVVVALLVGTLSQLLPLVERNPDKVSAWLSTRAGQPVRFDALKAQWTRRGPLLQLDGLRIGAGEGLRIGQAEVQVAMYAGLLPGRSLTELRLRGLALTLQRADDGRWSVRGLPAAKTGDPLDGLRRLGELQVEQGRLTIEAPSIGLQTTLPRLDLRLRVDADRLRVGVRAWAQADALPLAAVLDVDRRAGNGEAWLGGDPVDLQAWSPLLSGAGVQLLQGRGELNAWVALRDFRPVMVTTDSDLSGLRLVGTPTAHVAKPTLDIERLQVRARWRYSAGGWRAEAPRLRVRAEDREQVLDGLLIGAGQHTALVANNIDGNVLLRGLALTDRVDAGLRDWLYRAHPQLRVRKLQARGERNGPLWVQGDLDTLAFSSVDGGPGLVGIGGRFQGDAEGFSLQLQSRQQMQLDWPKGFGVRHDVRLAGEIVGWHDEAGGWRVGTPALRVQGTDYAADVRGGLWFQGDGTRPWMQLAAKIDDVPMTAAKRFWIRSRMSEHARDWLDTALQAGRVRNGIGLVAGDLDDWPFDRNNGRFEATGHIEDGTIRFQKTWPDMTAVEADIAFIGPGFSLTGRGDLAGVNVDAMQAGIEDFGETPLYVRAQSRSESSKLLAMLRRSPLHAQYGDTLDALSVSGPAAVDFDLLQPLRAGQPGHLKGSVTLEGVKLADKRYALDFDDVRGVAQYAGGGFGADNLAVRHLGAAGTLSLRAGGFVRDPQLAFESQLDANLDAGVLLDRAPEMAWLKPYITGRSNWTIGVDMPKAVAAAATGGAPAPVPPARLHLQSDLVGTVLSFPAPLDKPAGEALDTRVAAQLPMGDGRIEVAFGERLALAARTHQGQTGVQVTLGSARVDRDPPASGLAVNGRSGSLDALEWIGLARGSAADSNDGAGNDPMPLRSVDVQVAQLLLIGGVFEQTRLQLRPTPQFLDVRLDGPSLAGQLQVPTARGGTISGALQRVHWKSLPGPVQPRPRDGAPIVMPDGEVMAARVQATANDTDPAGIPPLSLDIADLQFGKITLGQATLRTQPVVNGLRVQQLDFRSPKQAIDVRGDWLGKGPAARTALTAQVRSEDLGDLLRDLDYGGQLRGGQGRIDLQAGWQGGPSDFQLGNLQGTMTVDARNGQLLELEPGAGRVLGLLSITQLPRRLMLDFRDFFSKGFAFNQIGGTLAFADGSATTDKVMIEGPAANIRIRGRTDLRNQQFDQTIDVNPRSGNLLTVVGAVAGGPVGAALGAATNAVLSKPLGEIGAKTYRVTGPWKEPKVDVVERDAAAPPPPKPKAR